MNPYEKLIRLNDDSVLTALDKQVNEPGSRHDGGIRNDLTGLPNPSHGGTAGYMASMGTALVIPESRFYRDEHLLAALHKAADYMLGRQHADGTISLGGTNFNSPPDTGFVVTGLAQLYQLLHRDPWERLKPVATKLKLFLERSIPALLTGGCHTPNHRWVLTAALASLYNIFQLEELVRRAEEWLAEGMDCTADGEWTERSNGIYNTVSDMMLFYTAKYLDRPDLLQHVRKNLNMMIYMLHANGEVVTDYSGRQDAGVKHGLSDYYLSYRLMADLDRDPLYAAMHDLTVETMTRIGPVNNHAMLGFLVFPANLDDITREPIPDQYTKIINEHHPITEDLQKMKQVGHHLQIEHSSMHTSFGSPLVRIRDRKTSVTAMTRSPSFFSLRHGEVKLLGISVSSMFMPGIVEMEQFAVAAPGYRMKTTMHKGYNGPIPQEYLPAMDHTNISPWYLLPHQHRPLTHVQQHEIAVEIAQEGALWNIRIHSDVREDVLTQVSFVFHEECLIAGDGLVSGEGSTKLWTSGVLHCTAGSDRIEISEGQQDHGLWTIRNAETQHGVQTVKVNLLSPFDKTFQIKLLS